MPIMKIRQPWLIRAIAFAGAWIIRGWIGTVRQMLRVGRKSHLAITPDGPRGPRRQVQPGLLYLAARTGLPIVPVGIGYDRPWRMRSWDRFAVPRPWTRATCVTTEPIHV